MPVVLALKGKSGFEKAEFDAVPATLAFQSQAASGILGGNTSLSDDDFRDIAGAPGGSTVEMKHMMNWGPTGDDKPPPGLYFFVKHPQFISGHNKIGLCHDPAIGYFIYIKDVFFNDQAPAGMASVALAKIVRFCLRYSVNGIALLAAGGRKWPNIYTKNGVDTGERWGGYYFWARCGFDMALQPQDAALLPEFAHPAHLSGCKRVSDVLKGPQGPEWWKMCGSGHFMVFDAASANSASVVALEAYLALKGL